MYEADARADEITGNFWRDVVFAPRPRPGARITVHYEILSRPALRDWRE